MVPPAQFPGLPLAAANFDWSANVLTAHQLLVDCYDRGMHLLRQEEGDPPRLRLQSEQIYHRMLPILAALEPEVGDAAWLEACADAFAKLMVNLEHAATTADGV